MWILWMLRLRCVVAIDGNTNGGAFLSGLGVFADSASDVGFVDELAIEGIVHRPDE